MSDLIRRDCTRTRPHGRHFWMIADEYLSCPGASVTGGSSAEPGSAVSESAPSAGVSDA